MPVVHLPDEFLAHRFDYIVVGGGTAGLALAVRLSETPTISIGVIEAGPHLPDDPDINIPGHAGMSLRNRDIIWPFVTTAQNEIDGRVIMQPRGKVLGGTSVVNMMWLGRASSGEYDELEKVGNPGWNWKSFLKYFIKSETLNPPSEEIIAKQGIHPDPRYHGIEGPVQKSYPQWYSDLHAPFQETIQKLGIPTNSDTACGDNIGITNPTAAIDSKTATRSSSVAAYYAPHSTRSNLVILLNARVSKVYFRDETKTQELKRAAGVCFSCGDQEYRALAAKEVILAAGAFQSPQLLELSGIGSESILTACGIQQIIELPGVGENLQDHVFVPIMYEVSNHLVTLDNLQLPEFKAEHHKLYQEQKGIYATGRTDSGFLPISTAATTEEIKVLREHLAKEMADGRPIVGFDARPIVHEWLGDPKCGQFLLAMIPGALPVINVPTKPGYKYMTLIASLMHPASRGSVHIQSGNPLTTPVIDPKYFSSQHDKYALLHGIKLAMKIAQSSPLKDDVITAVSPPPGVVSDEELLEYCKKNLATQWHPIGTASMVPREKGGVVDGKCVVYGTSNLRVMDASILPFLMTFAPAATFYAMAEKLADIMKEGIEKVE